MPWTCCEAALHDDQPCAACGRRKRSHTVRLDRTRVFSLGGPPWAGDAEGQARVLERAHAGAIPCVERCPPATFVEFQLVDAAEDPLPGLRVRLRLPDDREEEAWTDEHGRVRVRGLAEEDATRVRLIAPAGEMRHLRSEPAEEV